MKYHVAHVGSVKVQYMHFFFFYGAETFEKKVWRSLWRKKKDGPSTRKIYFFFCAASIPFSIYIFTSSS